MPQERTIGLDTQLRHNLLHKIKRGFGLWWGGEVSLRRIVNAGLCHLSLRRRRAKNLGKPILLTIEPTSACNLRCPLCPTGRETLGRSTCSMPLDMFKRCIDELGPYLMEIGVANYGEPMLHPDICEMIAYAKAAGPTVFMASNAHFLDEESARKLVESGLDRVWISFDGTDQETYEKYRVRGDLDKVIAGVKTLLAQREALGRTNPYIELQFLVMKHNEHQMDAFREQAKAIGADGCVIKPVSFNVADWDDEDTRKTFGDFFPTNEEYQVYRREGDDWQWKRDELDFCTAPWRAITILADGSIAPCCRDPRGRYTLGNVADGVLNVWNGEKYRAFRKTMTEHRGDMPICRVCPGE